MTSRQILLVAWLYCAASVAAAQPPRALSPPTRAPVGRPLLQDELATVADHRPEMPPRGRRAVRMMSAAEAAPATAAEAASNDDKIISHCLMITDLAVVNDSRASAGGKWSFAYLMRAMANTPATGIAPEKFVDRWLEHWRHDQLVNGFTVRQREDFEAFYSAWPRLANGNLDLDRAPFRLLAIVNRLDLRNNLVLGVPRLGGGGAGEARFVFCAVDASGDPQSFTLIFEYGIKRQTFDAVRDWARQWYALQDLPMGGDEYLRQLEALTEDFVVAGADPESPPNGSALAQLRTNEIAFGPFWEMREFRIDVGGTGYLRQVPVKQTPDISFDDSQALQDFVTENQTAILDKSHMIPVEYPTGQPFLAGSSPQRVNFRWKLPDAAPPGLEPARQLFAFHTCSGCHLAETGTQFVHIVPRTQSQSARLSQFLATPDTGDLALRKQDLKSLVEEGRGYEASRLPLQFVH